MQSNRLWVRGCALAVTFLLAAGALFAAPALKVLSATPKGQLTYTGRQAVNITFNQPVVALGEESEFSSSDCPISITPAVKGSCRYSGTQTLVFEPTSDWPEKLMLKFRKDLLGLILTIHPPPYKIVIHNRPLS